MTEKLYLQNPYLKEISAFIVEQYYRDGKHHIILDRTIFFPHMSGGQPGDKGTINGQEVLISYEEGDNIVHILENRIYTDKDRVTIEIDWERRLDLMQQHTGQHLLSSVFLKLLNCDTVGFYIGTEYVYIDLDISEISLEDCNKVEYLVNKIIQSNFEIKSYIIDSKEVSKLPLIKQPSVDNNIRIVEIDSYDYSPCSGTHLNYTGELGIIKIRKWEKYKDYTRLEFVCGSRALQDYSWKNQYIKEISLLLSSKDRDVLDRVNKLYNDRDLLGKENRALRESIYQYKAQSLVQKGHQIQDRNYIFETFENKDSKEIELISNYINRNYDNVIQVYIIKHETHGQFIVKRSNNLDINLRLLYEELASKYKTKGGGSPLAIQGMIPLNYIDEVSNSLQDYFIIHSKKS